MHWPDIRVGSLSFLRLRVCPPYRWFKSPQWDSSLARKCRIALDGQSKILTSNCDLGGLGDRTVGEQEMYDRMRGGSLFPDYYSWFTYAWKLNYRKLTSLLCWIAAFTITTNCSQSWGKLGRKKTHDVPNSGGVAEALMKRSWTCDHQYSWFTAMWSMVEAELSESRVWTSYHEVPHSTTSATVQLSSATGSLCLTLSRPIRKQRAVIDPDIKQNTKGH